MMCVCALSHNHTIEGFLYQEEEGDWLSWSDACQFATCISFNRQTFDVRSNCHCLPYIERLYIETLLWHSSISHATLLSPNFEQTTESFFESVCQRSSRTTWRPGALLSSLRPARTHTRLPWVVSACRLSLCPLCFANIFCLLLRSCLPLYRSLSVKSAASLVYGLPKSICRL